MARVTQQEILQRINDLTDIINQHTEDIHKLSKILENLDSEVSVIVDAVFEHNAELDS